MINSAEYKAMLAKVFYANSESATVALRKCRTQKNVNLEKGLWHVRSIKACSAL